MPSAKQWFLLKTEPSVYSIDDLERDGATAWDGITSAPALAHLRKARPGDLAAVYHTGDERRAVGVAEITSAPRADADAVGGKPNVFDVRYVARLASPVGLDAFKASAAFADSPLVRQGRLSCVPLTAKQWKALLSMAKTKLP
ncbi:MAG: EVE domain-containing protein [Deltaproteobacteria bacterium]|nr:EVE domain-containing protein [Deltaproteobacteria bacterium]